MEQNKKFLKENNQKAVIDDEATYLFVNNNPVLVLADTPEISVSEITDIGRYGETEYVQKDSKNTMSVYTLNAILNNEIILVSAKELDELTNDIKAEMYKKADKENESKYKKYYLDYKKSCTKLEKDLFEARTKINELTKDNNALKAVIEIKKKGKK